MRTKHEVIEDALPLYLKASKQSKKEILDRLEKVTHMQRKSIIRRLGELQRRKEGYDWHDKRGRPVYYTPDVVAALHEVWSDSHELCAERLKPILKEYIDILIRDGMWRHDDEATGKLRKMSLGTMKEFTQGFDKVISGGGRCMTKPSSLKEVIPVMRSSHRIRGLDPDSGGEFINWATKDWTVEKKIELTRIRPGMKNDHGRIEQKNDKNVRKWAGYIRMSQRKDLPLSKKCTKFSRSTSITSCLR